jgi:hypothetical protein
MASSHTRTLISLANNFGHRRFPGCLFALVLHRGGAIHEQTRGFDLQGHVSQFELDRLKLADRFAELLALG